MTQKTADQFESTEKLESFESTGVPRRKPTKGPRRKPDIDFTGIDPGLIDLADTEFMASVDKVLSKDAIARLGADPKRVTQMDIDTNVLGTFIRKGQKSRKFAGQHLEKVRPDLLEGDVVVLRASGNPAVDEGATLAHEFDHRGFDILRKYGVLKPSDDPDTIIFSIKDNVHDVRFDEESIIRAMDYTTGRDKKEALRWFADVHPDVRGKRAAKRILDNSELKAIIKNLSDHAAALQKFIRDDKKSDPNSPIESPAEIEDASSFKE